LKHLHGPEVGPCSRRSHERQEPGAETCEICGKSNTNVAYFRTGMTAVVYRHHECDRRVAMREPSAAEERQEWSLNKWLAEWEPWRIEPKEPVG
jgi:hypothetical protein